MTHKSLPTSVFFFFSSRRRHTRLQGDWSSDVCSSDLAQYQVLTDRVDQITALVEYLKGKQESFVNAFTSVKKIMGDGRSGMSRGGSLRSEEHTSELQSPCNLVCRLLLEKKKNQKEYVLIALLRKPVLSSQARARDDDLYARRFGLAQQERDELRSIYAQDVAHATRHG